jgi:hypothetical protein
MELALLLGPLPGLVGPLHPTKKRPTPLKAPEIFFLGQRICLGPLFSGSVLVGSCLAFDGVLSLCLAFGGAIRAFGVKATGFGGVKPTFVGNKPASFSPRPAFDGGIPTFGTAMDPIGTAPKLGPTKCAPKSQWPYQLYFFGFTV